MNLNDFSNLIEIQSLQNIIKKHLDEISVQEERIDYLRKKKARTIEDFKDVSEQAIKQKNELALIEKKLGELEKRISTLRSNQMLVKTNEQLKAIDKELLTLSQDKDQLEDIILRQLDHISDLDNQLSTHQSFINGVDKSIGEIKNEVEQIISNEKQKITNYQDRIDELIKLIPKEAKELFINLNKKYLYNNPITLVNNNACSKCNYPIDRNLSTLIEKGTMLELCPGCERLIAPHSAQYLPT